MNKKIKNLVPLCFLAAVIVFILIIVFVCKPKFEEFGDAQRKSLNSAKEREKLESESRKAEAEKQAENMKLKSIKTVYETDLNSSTENLGIFGRMFEEIIKKAQQNGLLIRSIEYNMSPETDPLYIESSDAYNVCELKFFFVGSYSQLQAFLNDMNKNFEYLTYFSSINVTAFSSNTDYLLINLSITLYSKKPNGGSQGNKLPLSPKGKNKKK